VQQSCSGRSELQLAPEAVCAVQGGPRPHAGRAVSVGHTARGWMGAGVLPVKGGSQ
jgi:hypothetical protein